MNKLRKKPANHCSGPSLSDKTAARDECIWKGCEFYFWFALQVPSEPSSPLSSCITKPHQSTLGRAFVILQSMGKAEWHIRQTPCLNETFRWSIRYEKFSINESLVDPSVVFSILVFSDEASMSVSSLRLVRCYPLCPVCKFPSLIANICSPHVLRPLLFCSQEKGMSPPERLITCP